MLVKFDPGHEVDPPRRADADPVPALERRLGEVEGYLRVIEQELRNLRWAQKRWWQRIFANRLVAYPRYAAVPLRLPAHYAATRPPEPAPLVSIVTPSYQQGRFLERTLRSVLDQGYPQLEYIVQDGGSTDDSAEVLDRYRPRLTHSEQRRDRGQAHAINLGFRHATGEILAYLNSDDLLLPGALAYVAGYFAAHPEVDVVYGQRVVIDENDGEIGRWVLPPHDPAVLRWCDFVPQETLFWRRGIWAKVGGAMDESFQFALDWDLLLRFAEAGARIVRLPRFLGAFRTHTEQKTLAWLKTVGEPESQRLRQRVLGRVPHASEIERAVQPYLRRHALCHVLYRLGILRY